MAESGGLARHRAERAGESSSRRTEIIDAAEALFFERGIASTTVIDIAGRVGVTRTTFYRYFEGRDELAFEVAGRMITKLSNTAREAVPAGAGPVEAARAALVSLIAHFEQNSDAHRFLMLLDSYRPFRPIREEQKRRFTERSRDALDLGVMFEDGAVDDVTIERLVAVTGVVTATLGRFAIKREILGRGPLTLHQRLGYLEEIVHNHFDTIMTPPGEPPAPSSR